jgi:O-antigen/teichoic acid export membrane protein
MSEAKRTGFDAALALVIRVLSAGLVFGLQVLLARLMPAEGYGGFVTLWTWMLALGSFAALGFAESSVRFLPRYHVRGRQAAVQAYWRFGFWLVTAVSVAVAGGAVGVAMMWGTEDSAGLMVLLVAVGLPFLAIEYFLEGVARSFGWFRLAAVPVYIVRPILVGAVCLILVGQGVTLSLPVVGAVLIGAMALISVSLAAVVARRLARMAPGTKAVGNRARRLWLTASLPLLLLSGIEDLTGYADVLLLSLLASPEHVGIYFAAARCLALAGFVAYAMTLVAGRRFALDLAGRSRADLQRNIVQSSRMTFWATLASVTLALVAGPVLLAAFGPEFVFGMPVMFVLGAGMVLRSLAGQAGEVLIVTGRQREGLVIGLVALVVTLVAGLALIPGFGLVGAAVAGALGMVCRTVGMVVVLARAEGLRVLPFGGPVMRMT